MCCFQCIVDIWFRIVAIIFSLKCCNEKIEWKVPWVIGNDSWNWRWNFNKSFSSNNDLLTWSWTIYYLFLFLRDHLKPFWHIWIVYNYSSWGAYLESHDNHYIYHVWTLINTSHLWCIDIHQQQEHWRQHQLQMTKNKAEIKLEILLLLKDLIIKFYCRSANLPHNPVLVLISTPIIFSLPQ